MKQILRIVTLVITLISTANCLDLSISGDFGSTSESISAGLGDSVRSNIVMSQDSLQNHISGSGSFNEDHWIKNDAGNTAGVGVNITDAKSYSYSYDLERSENDSIDAGENLDVDDAVMIYAYSESRASIGNSTKSEVTIEYGSLKGYSNEAWVSEDGLELGSGQDFSKADGNHVMAVSRGARRDVGSTTHLDVNLGNITDYSDLSRVTSHPNLKQVIVNQQGHLSIIPSQGRFRSSSYLKTPNKDHLVFRKSSYGNEYDFHMCSDSGNLADKPGWFHYAPSGTLACSLAYYVDMANPLANKIHEAIRASEDGDSIRVAPGNYYENLVLDKSLKIIGSGADKTIIDGHGQGHVIKVKEDANVHIGQLALTNGKARYGGGIYNEGDLTLDNCRIYSNEAIFGGGAYNDGNLTINDVNISENQADYGGGVYNNFAWLYLNGGNISKNTAINNGGGIYNNWFFTRGIYGDTSIVHDNVGGDLGTLH